MFKYVVLTVLIVAIYSAPIIPEYEAPIDYETGTIDMEEENAAPLDVEEEYAAPSTIDMELEEDDILGKITGGIKKGANAVKNGAKNSANSVKKVTKKGAGKVTG